MAIDTEAARLLLMGAGSGISFADTITLGRQRYLPNDTESRRLLREFGVDAAKHPDLFANPDRARYAEPFFRLLGARRVESIDASGFEGATLVHDFNRPVGSELEGQFDVVYDGGTLEHVFDFLAAIRNCIALVRVGGRVILHTTANNYFGHGFYQFSPELFFRIFAPENGFALERLIAIEYGPCRRWREVRDPALIEARTPLINAYPVLLFVQARKEANGPLFEPPPQQSDYRALWGKRSGRSGPDDAAERPMPTPLPARLKRIVIGRWPGLARMIEALWYSRWNRNYSFRNRVTFQPVDKRRS